MNHLRTRPAPRCRPALLVATLTWLLAGCEHAHEVSISEIKVAVVEETVGRGKPVREADIACIDFQVHDAKTNDELLFGQNFCFQVGAGAVIAGIDEAVVGMRLGGRRLVKCPPHKHWGRAGYGGQIPASTPLLIDLKVVGIE